MRRTPALIVGGGPAGATLALRLARARVPHFLVERTRETPDALCGGFLSWHSLALLEKLGIPGEQLNPATVTRVRLMTRRSVAEVPLPAPARAVSRRRLDAVLLHAAINAGAVVERGIGVRAIEGEAARLDDATCLLPEAMFLASGKHDTRGAARPSTACGDDPTLGFRIRLVAGRSLDRLLGDAIELHLFDRGYAGLVRQEDGGGNLCLAVRRSRLKEAGSADRLLATIGAELPMLGDRLALRAQDCVIDAVANVPYGWRARTTSHGVFRLGDQAGVIPSLAGEGMAIAFMSAVAASDAFRRYGSEGAATFQSRLASRLRAPLAVAGGIWHAAEHQWAAEIGTRFAGRFPGLLQATARATRV